MSHENLPKAVMSVFHRSDTPRASASRYNVLNRKVLQMGIKLESVQEEQYIPLVEYENYQQI